MLKKTISEKIYKKTINWLKDKNEFLKLYNEIIKNGKFKDISSKIFKDFVEDILNGKINNNNRKEKYKKRFDDVEKNLTKSEKSERVNELKNPIKINNSVYGKDKDKIRTDKARSFKDQKGKGYADLPILLSKMYTNNNSKELKTNTKNLLNHIYDNKQITKQVYNILNKAIIYKNDS